MACWTGCPRKSEAVSARRDSRAFTRAHAKVLTWTRISRANSNHSGWATWAKKTESSCKYENERLKSTSSTWQSYRRRVYASIKF